MMTRRTKPRRKGERRTDELSKLEKQALKMVENLRMQARVITAANRRMRVEPIDPERTLQWAAADMIEKFIGL